MRLTVSQLRSIIKEEVAMAMGSPEQHTEDCVYSADDTFVCSSCGEEVCWCQGAADDMPNVCTGCWEKSQKMPAVREGKTPKLTLRQLRNIVKETVQSAVREPARRLSEGHARITEEEFAAWKSGDWGFVSEHDGGGPRRRSMDVIPADADKLTSYIIRNYEGMCADLGCDDVSDPEFKEYVSDQLAGKVDPMTLKMALAGL